jgi:hypothetical protein
MKYLVASADQTDKQQPRRGRHMIAQDVSPGSGEKTIAGTASPRGLFIT